METQNKMDNWPDSARLKMIERSEFYAENSRVYQYGYYDGFQHRNELAKELLDALIEASETLKIIAEIHPVAVGDSLTYNDAMKQIGAAIKKATS